MIGASLDRTLQALRDVCHRTVIPIQLPIGEEKSFRGVVDLVAMKAWTFATDGSGKPSDSEIPADLAAPAQAAWFATLPPLIRLFLSNGVVIAIALGVTLNGVLRAALDRRERAPG